MKVMSFRLIFHLAMLYGALGWGFIKPSTHLIPKEVSINNKFHQATVSILLSLQLTSVIPPSAVYAAESVTTNTISQTFPSFVSDLESGKINKVVFNGINPTYLTAYYKTGDISVVKEGFPSYDDPRSPSGPAQAIAKVQHTPGVICQQDISDALLKSTTRKNKNGNSELKPMLQHAAYPKSL